MIEAMPSQQGDSRSFRMYYYRKEHEYKMNHLPEPLDYITASDSLNGLVYASLKDLAKPVNHFVTAFENEAVDLKLEVFVRHMSPAIEDVNDNLTCMANKILRRTIFGDIMAASHPEPITRRPREVKYRDTDEGALGVEEKVVRVPSNEHEKEYRLERLSTLKCMTEWFLDYYLLNISIVEHLLRKLGRDISLIEADVISMAIRQMIKSNEFNVLLGGFAVLEVLTVLDRYAGELLKASGSWLNLEQKKLVHDVEQWCVESIEVVQRRRREILKTFLPTAKAKDAKSSGFQREGQVVEANYAIKQKEILDKINAKIENSIKGYNEEEMQKLRDAQISRYQNNFRSVEETPLTIQARRLLTREPSPDHDKPLIHYHSSQDGPSFFDSDDEAYKSMPADLLINSCRPYITRITDSLDIQEKKVETQTNVNTYIVIFKQFLYNIFYYCQIPTFIAQLVTMDAPPYVVGLIFCLAPFAAGFADIGFNYEIRKKYRMSIVMSFILLQVAILLHILAAGYNYIWLLIISRLVAGCSEDNVAVNTYIAREAIEEKRQRFGFMLITSYALAIGLGSGLSALLIEIVPQFNLGSLVINQFNITQVVLLLVYLPITFIFIKFFKDHDQDTKDIRDTRKHKTEVPVKYYTEDYGFNLSINYGIINLPDYCTTLETLADKINEEKAKIKKESIHEKQRLARRYFARGQVHYLIKYLCCMWIFIEATIIDSPFYLIQVKKLSPEVVGTFFFIQLALLPLCSWVLPTYLKSKISASNLVKYLTISIICALLMRVQWSPAPYNEYAFMILQLPLLSLSLFGAGICMSFLNELSSDFQIDKAFGTGFIRSMIFDWGRFGAGVIVSIGASISRGQQKYHFTNNFVYPIFCCYMAIMLVGLGSVKSRLDYKKL